MDEWKVVRSSMGAFLCTSAEQADKIIALYNIKDAIVEKYCFEEHCQYTLKVK